MRFDALLRTLEPDVTTYVARYPAPVLLLEPYREEGTSPNVDTPVLGSVQLARTYVAGPRVALPAPAPSAGDLVHPQAQVAWLTKSSNNPFVGMITLGRAANNDVTLSDPSVSKLHAIFSCTDGWLIEDRRSQNGTFVDGVRLPPELRRPVADGAGLRFGEGVVARFFLPRSFFEFCTVVRGGQAGAG